MYIFKTKPYKHQIECFNYAETHDRFLLADQQGLGKTKEVIDIACNFKQKNKYEHCLIICGVNGLKWNWEQEILIHSSETGHILGAKKKKNNVIIGSNENKLEDLENIDTLPYFIITNIESLRYKVKTGKTKTKRYRGRTTVVEEYKYPITDKLVELCKSGKINMIAADECHKMKNPESEQGQQFLRLNAEIKIAMTGTPILNTPLDLFIILKWLGYEDHSFWQFKSHYCRLGGYGGYEVIGYKNTQQLTDTLNKMMIRRLKKDVLDLPEKNYIIEYVEMSSRQKKIYDSIRNELLEEIDLISSSSNPLSMLIRARQATGYTGILSSSVQESAKLDRLEEIVQTIIEDGEKAVIFSNWTSITDEIVNRLNKYSPLVITGETKDSDRQVLVNEFQTNDKNKIIIGTVGAMGTGLTLTAAQNVIFVDEPWNMGIREQAEDRCHRIGQNNTVNIYILLTKNTIDERIHNLVQSKGDISDAIVDKKELVQYLLS